MYDTQSVVNARQHKAFNDDGLYLRWNFSFKTETEKTFS